ncbi:MAG TPA: enoyl-CoA hydratase/isomerase family protein [Mycobacterium sp.]|nr:enoyl-CoA hydratase/isomerase family protein [Mycobacterium sp.]
MGDGLESRIRVERDGRVLRIVLVRPERGNAIDAQFVDELRAAAFQLNGSVGCIAIVAEGETFCVGGDVRVFAEAPEPGTSVYAWATGFHQAVLALMASAAPIVVGVQGWAAGGGLSLALLADVLVLGRSARVRTAYTAIGLTPDGGMSWTLPRAVGASRARDLILTNRAVSAAEAEAMGLATRVVDDQELRATVDRLAAELADGATDALGTACNLVHGGWSRTFVEQLDEEAKAIAASADSVQGREGVRAFVERRAPRYHG